MKIRFKSKDTKDQAQNGIPGAAPRSFSRGRLAFPKRSWHQTKCEKKGSAKKNEKSTFDNNYYQGQCGERLADRK